MLNTIRQEGIIQNAVVGKARITLIGAGGIGSFVALTLAKMGVKFLTVYDFDTVSSENIPNQFYPLDSIGKYKVDALLSALIAYAGVVCRISTREYKRQKLLPITIVTTDSMRSRKLAWEQFKMQKGTAWFIDARMGAQLGKVFCIHKDRASMKFYESTLHTDDQAVRLRCTEKAIIYNVLMVSSLVCRAVKAVILKEKDFPKEQIFNMQEINKASFMVRG
jgi:hypothetical protein